MPTTIEVGGKTEKDAPSPVQLKAWQDDWTGQLANLTNWTHPDKTRSQCTTTTGVDQTEAVVGDDLKAWVKKDPGNRHYKVF